MSMRNMWTDDDDRNFFLKCLECKRGYISRGLLVPRKQQRANFTDKKQKQSDRKYKIIQYKMFVKERNFSFNWDGYTLIQPSISVGLVGQFAVDLILNNIADIEKVGYFYDSCFEPVIGSNPFGNNDTSLSGICTSCEVFQSKSHKLVIIQQRAPFIKGRIPSYRKKLIKWLIEYKLKQVIILGSCSSHIKNDLEMTKKSLSYLASSNHAQLEKKLTEQFEWEKFTHTRMSLSSAEEAKELFIPGGGITKSLFEECSENKISAIALLVFSNDGIGSEDALIVADGVGKLLSTFLDSGNFFSGPLKIPASWKGVCRMSNFQPIF